MKKDVIGLVNYGKSGNIFNVIKAFEAAGAALSIIHNAEELNSTDKIVLPGVGCFKDAMEHLDPIKQELRIQMQKKPSLGICLGMQILSKIGFEFGETEGLSLIDAEVKKMEIKGKVPHLGWGALELLTECPIFEKISADDKFYFMHSYEVINFTNVVSLTEYCNHKFVSAVRKDNLFGVQFHPEKSREPGIQVIKNFVEL